MPAVERPPSVSILIDGKRIGHWSELEVTDCVDAFSKARFLAPFEAARAEFRELFRPFQYRPVRIFIDDDPLFTGTLVDVNPSVDPERRVIECSAYALPTVLVDCTAPGSAVPHEFRKLTLEEIARALLAPFELQLELDGATGAAFDKVKLEEQKKLYEFLSELAQQRSQLLSNTPDGALLCWGPAKAGNPVARFESGKAPLTGVTAEFRPQEYYSEITGFAAARRGRKGSKYTALNPWLEAPLRPSAFRLDNTEKGDAPDETKSRMGRMFANVASYTTDEIPTWWDAKGNLYRSNTTARVLAPDAMIYHETELLIREVRRKQHDNNFTCVLEFCLLGSFTGEPPDDLPWND